MAITRDNVLHVAKLARLELSETEIDTMQRDLDGILEYVNQLSELDTTDVPPTTQIAVVAAPFRADVAAPQPAARSGAQPSAALFFGWLRRPCFRGRMMSDVSTFPSPTWPTECKKAR